MATAIFVGQFRRAALLIFIAGLTDASDGFLARRLQATTRLGSYLDPLADKLFLVLGYLALGLQGAVPIWLTWLVLGRDAAILGMVAIALLFTDVRSFPPSLWGKMSTIVQIFTALTAVVDRAWLNGGNRAFEGLCLAVTAAVTAISGIYYTYIALRDFPAARREHLSH